jgi:nitrite reductase/ring-hydroxylating ferredoxin subunit
MAAAQPVCHRQDLAGVEARGYAVMTECEHGIFIVPRAGMFYGYLNRCPHRGLPLNWLPDRFLDTSGTYIQCANHDALFTVTEGRCVAGPCAGASLTPVRLVLRGDELWLDEAPAGAG